MKRIFNAYIDGCLAAFAWTVYTLTEFLGPVANICLYLIRAVGLLATVIGGGMMLYALSNPLADPKNFGLTIFIIGLGAGGIVTFIMLYGDMVKRAFETRMVWDFIEDQDEAGFLGRFLGKLLFIGFMFSAWVVAGLIYFHLNRHGYVESNGMLNPALVAKSVGMGFVLALGAGLVLGLLRGIYRWMSERGIELPLLHVLNDLRPTPRKLIANAKAMQARIRSERAQTKEAVTAVVDTGDNIVVAFRRRPG